MRRFDINEVTTRQMACDVALAAFRAKRDGTGFFAEMDRAWDEMTPARTFKKRRGR